MVTVDTFLKELDAVNTSLLLGIQKLAKIAESRSSERTQEQITADSGRRNRHSINSFSSPYPDRIHGYSAFLSSLVH